MRINKIILGATIATGQYQNIQPTFEITDIEKEKDAIDYGMNYINELYQKYSVTGALKEQPKSLKKEV